MIEITEKYSPDKNYKLEFFDSIEPKMGMNMCKFSLVNLHNNKKINFEPLFAVGYNGYSTSWSENSNYFALPVCSPSECFFIYDIEKGLFTSIRFCNVWILAAQLKFDKIEFEYENSQIPERTEHIKYPSRKNSKVTNMNFQLSELQWENINNLQQFKELNKNLAILDLKPNDNNWTDYKGQLPQTTEVIDSELNEFAKLGDKQSNEWFNEIKSKTKDVNYWVKASKYLEIRKRNENRATKSNLPKAERSWWQKLFGSK